MAEDSLTQSLQEDINMVKDIFENSKQYLVSLAQSRFQQAFDQVRSARISDETKRLLREAKKLQTLRQRSLVEAVCFGWKHHVKSEKNLQQVCRFWQQHIRRRILVSSFKHWNKVCERKHLLQLKLVAMKYVVVATSLMIAEYVLETIHHVA